MKDWQMIQDEDRRQQMADFKAMFEPEELHADLLPYVDEMTKDGWKALQHPLVYAVPYLEMENKRLNKQYIYKIEAIDKATKDGDWNQVVWLHERPWRLEALLKIEENLDTTKYWELVREIWIDSENITQNLEEWKKVWSGRRRIPKLMMTDEDYRSWLNLSDPLVVYRGYHRDKKGISWTLSLETARWFANRFGMGKIAVGRLRKDKVVAYFGGRGEDEVVAFPDDVSFLESLPGKEEK